MAIKKRSGFENEDIIAKAKALTDYVLSIKTGFETINFTNLQPFKEFQSSLLDFAKILPKPVATAEIAKTFLPITDYSRILQKIALTPLEVAKKLMEGMRVEFPYPLTNGMELSKGKEPNNLFLTETVALQGKDSLFSEEKTVVTEIEIDKPSAKELILPLSDVRTLRGIVKRVIFYKSPGRILLKGRDPIKVKENTPMFRFCQILFCTKSNIGKKWSADVLKEIVGVADRTVSKGVKERKVRVRGGSGEPRDQQIYDLVKNLNAKIGLKNFIVFNNKWVSLNPQYAEYYK